MRLGGPSLGRDGGQASKAKHWTLLKLVTQGGSPAPAWCPTPAFRGGCPLGARATVSEPGHGEGLKGKGWAGLTC